MRRIVWVILALVVPVAGAVVLEVIRPHRGAERAFIFVLAIALGIGLAVTIGGGNPYPPSVAQAIDAARDASAPSAVHEVMGCAWPVLLVLLLLTAGFVLLVMTICGPVL